MAQKKPHKPINLIELECVNGVLIVKYHIFILLFQDLISRVEDEHREKLQQLNSIHDEQR